MNQPLRLAMYLRKSSEAEDRQQLSIPAQERELRELAARQGLVVVGEPIAEAMSAKRPGRPGFAKLMQKIARHQVDGILVWALDRLARNPIDGGSLMWALGERQIQAIVAPDKSYTGSGDDKLMMSIMFGMATKYSDDLSKNVKRGNRQALLGGRWPSLVPIGYLRLKDKEIGKDPDRWAMVRRLWDRRLARVGVKAIHAEAKAFGLTTPHRGQSGGRPLSISELYALFNNRFYVSEMHFSGEVFPGNHPPMVTDAEFFQVREMTRGRRCLPISEAKNFRYRRMIRCAACQAAVTAESKRNRYGTNYVYYHCGRKSRVKGYCSQRCVQEAAIDEDIVGFLDELTLPHGVAELVLEELEYQAEAGRTTQKSRLAQLRKRLATIDNTLVNLRRMRARNEIAADDFLADQAHYGAERHTVAAEVCDLERDGVIEPLKQHVSLLNEAKSRFEAADDMKKREFLNEVSSNLSLQDKKVLVLAKEPFESLRRLPKIPTKWAVSEIVRTLLDHHIPKDHG